ncbi:MAG: hypothetical protein RMK84_07840 [Oscillochloridaceae bacterium]|nr:hypothetical protein [Chloroflexaceae bacterium]MDW8390022.1 hypothetical protein [Oscillochloridaceae bacterium]
MEWLALLVAGAIYPGLLTAIGLGALFGLLARGRARWPVGAGFASQEGVAAIGSVVGAGLALAMLPWPLHPLSGVAAWPWAWAGFELAFLLPLIPALATGLPTVARAAIREAQLGVLARAVIWLALGPALAAHADWRVATTPGHVLALAVALLVFPAATGWGPFGTEESITPGGAVAGLPEAPRALDAWARDVRAGALLGAIVVAGFPVGAGFPGLGLLVAGAGFVCIGLILRRVEGRIPRLSLPDALRLGLAWALPLAAVALAVLSVAERLLRNT